jgi:glyoxylase-like metal-dependent hydrolase (beta-lactamase superfamily II)
MTACAIAIPALVFTAAIGCGTAARPTAVAPPVVAEPPIRTPAVPADPTSWHMERIADGVYAYLGPPGVTPLVSGNSVVIVGDDGVVVVDTGQLPSIARREIDEIRKLTDRRVRYVVTTHWHPDHWVGNGEFRRAYPGAIFVATPSTRAMAHTKAQPFITVSYTRNTIAAVRPMLDKGTGPDGKPLRAITRAYLTLGIAQLDEYGGELARAQLAPPSATFEDTLSVWLGKREVDVRFLGRGNTGGDAVVWVPDAKVLATGDLLVSPYPYAIGSFIGEWRDTLDRLDEFGATTVIPGHGPVMHDLSYAHAVRDLLRDLQAQVKLAVARGSTLDDTRAAIKLDAAQAALCKGDPWCKNGFAGVFVAPAVARAYREAKEGPLHDED